MAPTKPLLCFATRNVPRYTSYPTAPHFSEAIGSDDYRQWLDSLPRDAALSLYLHVPYCVEICRYCGCGTKAVRRSGPVEAYAEALLAEIGLLKMLAGRKVTHLHWGGGTPSILGAPTLERIIGVLRESFDLSGLDEQAIEIDPRHASTEFIAALGKLGFTRASLGVQDFTPEVQRAIGRTQPFDTVARVVGDLRDNGIENVNFDLMYGLPHQTVANAVNTARQAAALRPQRIALFGYAHVPWIRKHQRLIDEAALPGVMERLAQAEAAADALIAAGYVAIGLDHFALPDDALAVAARTGTLRRNFQGYTTDNADALIGLGATAIGQLPQGFAQNAPDVAGYMRTIEAGHFATKRGLALSADDRLRGSIIERLMCNFTVDLDALGADRNVFAAEFEALGSLARAGLITRDGTRVTVTEAGRPYVRVVAATFDAYLAAGQARHSVAV